METAKVIVVGAGLAGLAAARELARAGLNPLVLEARRSIGGRASEAEFVREDARELRDLGIAVERCRGEHYCVFAGRVQRVRPAFPLLLVAGGFRAAADLLAEGVRIRCGAAVQAVQWTRGSVLLSTTQGPVQARAAIFALPVPVWGSLPVEPPLPREIIRTRPEIAVRLEFAEPIWGERFPGLAMLHSADPVLPVWWPGRHADAYTLTGWAGGRRARNLSALPQEEVRRRAVETLARLLREHPRELAPLVRACRFHDWQSDPFARGGRAAESGAGATCFGGTLFLAGEHLAGEPPDALSALRSGRRAARRLLAETDLCPGWSNS